MSSCSVAGCHVPGRFQKTLRQNRGILRPHPTWAVTCVLCSLEMGRMEVTLGWLLPAKLYFLKLYLLCVIYT